MLSVFKPAHLSRVQVLTFHKSDGKYTLIEGESSAEDIERAQDAGIIDHDGVLSFEQLAKHKRTGEALASGTIVGDLRIQQSGEAEIMITTAGEVQKLQEESQDLQGKIKAEDFVNAISRRAVRAEMRRLKAEFKDAEKPMTQAKQEKLKGRAEAILQKQARLSSHSLDDAYAARRFLTAIDGLNVNPEVIASIESKVIAPHQSALKELDDQRKAPPFEGRKIDTLQSLSFLTKQLRKFNGQGVALDDPIVQSLVKTIESKIKKKLEDPEHHFSPKDIENLRELLAVLKEFGAQTEFVEQLEAAVTRTKEKAISEQSKSAISSRATITARAAPEPLLPSSDPHELLGQEISGGFYTPSVGGEPVPKKRLSHGEDKPFEVDEILPGFYLVKIKDKYQIMIDKEKFGTQILYVDQDNRSISFDKEGNQVGDGTSEMLKKCLGEELEHRSDKYFFDNKTS